MSGNRFGTLFQYQSFGESHGEAIGCIVDGVPPMITLSEEDIMPFLERRKPASSKYTTRRKEQDRVKILSGVFEGQTTGTPIGLLIENEDMKSKDYNDIKDLFRPSHADYTYHAKYGIRDYRGGGRSSARETAMRVAAGAIARKILSHQISDKIVINAGVVKIGKEEIDYNNWSDEEIYNNPFFTPDCNAVEKFGSIITEARKSLSSLGAVIEIRVKGVPAGLGCPVYDKLDADLAKALMSINAVKAVEFGAGFGSAEMYGQECADQIYANNESGDIGFSSNNAGGILGGISTGQEIIARIAFKPTASIAQPLDTVDIEGNPHKITTKGRHDPCVGIRGAPVAEAMTACVLADHWLRYKAQCL